MTRTGFSFAGRAILLESTGDAVADAKDREKFAAWMKKIRGNAKVADIERGVSKLEEIMGRFRK